MINSISTSIGFALQVIRYQTSEEDLEEEYLNRVMLLAPNTSDNPYKKSDDRSSLRVISTGWWEDVAQQQQMRLVNIYENYLITLADALGKLEPIP